MAITGAMVKELRERTGAGMMDCKKVLTETNGDMDKAIELLREKGLAAAAKKAGRIAAEGLIGTYVNNDSTVGAIAEVNCETDFVGKNQEFIDFVNKIAEKAAASDAATVEEFLATKFTENNTVQETLTALIAKIGENMNVRRYEKFATNNGVVVNYIHGGGRIGVLVELACDKKSDTLLDLGKDIAMQIAALNPKYISEADVPGDYVEKEKEILKQQAINEGKDAAIVEKMIVGRLKKQLKEICLLDQLFVKDGDKTIAKLLQEKSDEVGSEIKVVRFARFEKGEGIEKKEENFAQEVMAQIQNK